MKNSIFNLVILGKAGSGKGTQAEFLVKKFKMQKIEAGNLVRQKAKEDSELGRYFHQIHSSGSHATDEKMNLLVIEAIMKLDLSKGILIDGYPRSEGQARDLDYAFLIKKVSCPLLAIYVNVKDQTSIERLSKRSVCENGHILSGRDFNQCPVCGGNVRVRDYDTNLEAIKKRIEHFHKVISPAVQYYKQRGILLEVNGEQDPQLVFQEILEKI